MRFVYKNGMEKSGAVFYAAQRKTGWGIARHNHVAKLLNLPDAGVANGVKYLVFSFAGTRGAGKKRGAASKRPR